MLTEIQKHPVRYRPGETLSSLQGRDIVGVVAISVPVGGYFIIPENLQKIITTERFGHVFIDRCFLTLNGRDLFPIFIKIYDAGEANVLLMKQGIQCFLNLINREGKQVKFLNDVLFRCAVTEMECLDSGLYSVVADFYNSLPHSNNIANDTSASISCGLTDLSIGYPWDSGNMISDSLKIQLRLGDTTQPRKLAHYLHDLSVQVDLLFNDEVSLAKHPLMGELIDRFVPKLGESYEDFAFDPLTDVSMKEPVLAQTTVLRTAGIFSPSKTGGLADNPDSWEKEGYEKVTRFSSELLHLCVWVHQLPFHELVFRYTLPKRDVVTNTTIPSNLSVLYSSLRNKFASMSDLKSVLDRVCLYWDLSKYTSIEIIKTKRDELFLTFFGVETRRIYVDLVLTTLLSQSIVRID